MALLPQCAAPYVFAAIQAAVTTAVATGIATGRLTGVGPAFFVKWGWSWLIAWGTVLPIVLGIAPTLQRIVLLLTSRNLSPREERR